MLELAKTVKKAAELREASWATVPQMRLGQINHLYTKSLRQCVNEATDDERIRECTLIMLTSTWNEALAWADQVLEESKETSQ